jgi:hypothetical protein
MSKLIQKLSRGKGKEELSKSSPSLEQASQNRRLYSKSISVDSIRILTLYPGIWADPIKCELRHAPLHNPGPYQALSYTWNNSNDDNQFPSITCNELPTLVSFNLYLGLQQLRDKWNPVRLWVDAICINQNDTDERTCHVGMMREIYERSTEVIIWLGESGPNDHLGQMVLPTLTAEESYLLYRWQGDSSDLPKLKAYMSKEVIARREQALDRDGDMVDVFGAFRVMHALLNGVEASEIQELRHFSKTGPVLKGFDALMNQRWVSSSTFGLRTRLIDVFSVVSPLDCSRSRGCAECDHKIWSAFGTMEAFRAHAALRYEKGRLGAHADSIYPHLKQRSLLQFSNKILEIETTRNQWRSVEPLGLLPLLRKFRSRSASDERDKVFALLGLVRFWRFRERQISPDYNLSAIDVAFQTTKSMLASYGSLSVLAGTLRRSERYDSNPSWVIDWNCPPTLNEDIRLENISCYNAGGSNGLIELHKQRILKIEETCLDEVISVGEELVDTTIVRARFVVKGWIDLLAGCTYSRPSFSDYIGGGSVSDAFWRTICGNFEYVRPGENGSSIVTKGFRRATEEGALFFEQFRSTDYGYRRTTSIIGGFWQESQESNANIARGTAFLQAAACASAGRRFFVTKRGYIGMGPRIMSIGDYAFVISGSQVPFILRRTHGSEACYGASIETLNSAMAAQSIYTPAGKGAKAPKNQENCYRTHSDPYHVIGDAYVHGVMNGEFMDPGTKESIFLV